MTVINKRNAVVGYLTIKTGKVVARRKAKQMGGKLTNWRQSNGNNSKSEKSRKKSK